MCIRDRAEDGIAGHQQFRSCFDDLCDRVVSYTAVDFNFKRQTQFAAQFGQAGQLFQRERDKLLSAEAGIHAHDEDVVDHGKDFDKEIYRRRRVDNYAGLHAVVGDELKLSLIHI